MASTRRPHTVADIRGIDPPPGATIEVNLEPVELRVHFVIDELVAVAGWNAETSFFGELSAASAGTPCRARLRVDGRCGCRERCHGL